MKRTLISISAMLYKIFFGVLFLLAAFQSYAASFPCHKANTWVEKTICSTQQLSHLDELLATAYKKALRNAFNKNALKADQRAWLKIDRAFCENISCIRQAYTLRISELKADKGYICTRRKGSKVNLRKGPGTNFSKGVTRGDGEWLQQANYTIEDGVIIYIYSKTRGKKDHFWSVIGNRWWGAWVRSDFVCRINGSETYKCYCPVIDGGFTETKNSDISSLPCAIDIHGSEKEAIESGSDWRCEVQR